MLLSWRRCGLSCCRQLESSLLLSLDRLAIGRIEWNAGCDADHGGDGFLESLDAAVRDGDALTEAG